MTKEGLFDKLKSAKLESNFYEIEPYLRNSIRLYLEPSHEYKIKIGHSKMGGQPDLPPNVLWPIYSKSSNESGGSYIDYPLSFIAQINLFELAQFDIDNLLPNKGLLYFFYSAENQPWGGDSKEKEEFKMIYYDGNIEQLARADYPMSLSENGRFRSSILTGKNVVSLPNDFISSNDSRLESIYDLVFDDNLSNKLLGYPFEIQGEMELDCELTSKELVYKNGVLTYTKSKANEYRSEAKNWQLLLQVDSNEDCDMMWGDNGLLYFWIKLQDLADKKFENGWFFLQCY